MVSAFINQRASIAKPCINQPRTLRVHAAKYMLCDSVLVYTASGLSPILPGPMGDENDSDGESEDGFESSTWVCAVNVCLFFGRFPFLLSKTHVQHHHMFPSSDFYFIS